MGVVHQINKVGIILRADKMYVSKPRQLVKHRTLYIWVQVDWIKNFHVLPPGNARNGITDIFKAFAKAFAAMACYEDQFF